MCLCLLQINKIIPTSITYHPHFRTAADEEQLTVERIGVWKRGRETDTHPQTERLYVLSFICRNGLRVIMY